MTTTGKQSPWETLGIHETSEYLDDTPVATPRYWRLNGRGPKSFVLGGRVRYRRADLDAWIAGQYAQAVGDETPQAS